MKENFDKLQKIIHQILALKISLISIENVMLNHILFQLMMLRLHQITFKVQKKIFLTYIIKIMTINDQIRDEKLQYDINREAAKISALSSGKIHKYEYLTSEDILPSNQQQIIEQARFTYSPLRIAFEKQIKTIEDQGQKQFKTSNTLKPKEQTKAITYKSDDDDDNTPISKKCYDEILKRIMDEILKMNREINYSNLVYDFQGPATLINFAIFGGPMYTYNQLKNGEKIFQQVEEEQKYF